MGAFKAFRDWYSNSREAKDFLKYIIFVVLFSIVTFEGKPGVEQFHINSLVQSKMSEGVDEVETQGDMFDWLRGSFADNLFPMNKASGEALDFKERLYIAGSGRIMGAMRLRQARSVMEDCSIPDQLNLYKTEGEYACQTPYTLETIAKNDIFASDSAAYAKLLDFTDPFTYSTAEELSTTSIYSESMEYGDYGQDGFNIDVIPNIAPDLLATKLSACKALVLESIDTCVQEQGVQYDFTAPPPPPPPSPPPPSPPVSSDSSSLIKLSELDADMPTSTLNAEVTLSCKDDTYDLRFEVVNAGTCDYCTLNWEMDIDSTNKPWISPTETFSNSQGAGVSWDPTYTGGIIITHSTEFDFDDEALFPSGETTFVEEHDIIFSDLNPTAQIQHATLHVSLYYNKTEGSCGASGSFSVPGQSSEGGRSLQSIDNSSTQTMAYGRSLLATDEDGTCSIDPLYDGLVIPSTLDTSLCKLVEDPDDLCELPYLSFQKMLDLMQPEKCGDCACQSDTDATCLESCSARSIFLEQIDLLQENNWVDSQSRAIMLDVSFFFENFNLFTVHRTTFEMPDFGGLFPSDFSRTFKIFRYLTSRDNVVLILECVFMGMIVMYTLEEIVEMFRSKWAYFGDLWNYIDWANLIILYIVIGIRFWSHSNISKFTPLIDSEAVTYIDFPPIASFSTKELNISAFNFFLVYFKIFKFLGSVPRMNSILKTCSNAAFDLWLFSVMAVIVLTGFAAAFYTCFGSSVGQYKTIGSALSGLLLTSLGDINYSDLVDANGVMAPILFYSYILMVFFILLNMFLAILNDSYADVKAEETVESLNYYKNLKDKFTNGLKGLFNRKQMIHNIAENLKESDVDLDNLIDEKELERVLADNPEAYEILKTTGAKDILSKYDMSGDGVLDKDEMTAILKDLAEKEASLTKEIKSKEDELTSNQPHVHRGGRGSMVASALDTTILEGRMDTMEGQIKDMSRNMAKKLSLQIDLLMSLSDQISSQNPRSGTTKPNGL